MFRRQADAPQPPTAGGSPRDPDRHPSSPTQDSPQALSPATSTSRAGGSTQWAAGPRPAPARRQPDQARHLEAEHAADADRRPTSRTGRRCVPSSASSPTCPPRGEPDQWPGGPTGASASPPTGPPPRSLAGAYPFLAEEGLGSAGHPHRPRRLVRHGVLLRPVGPLPARRADQPQHRLGRPDRPREIRPGQIPRLPVRRLRPAGLRPRRPQRRMDRRRPSRRRPSNPTRRRRTQPAQPPRRRTPPIRHRTTPPGSARSRPAGWNCSARSAQPPWAGQSSPTERSALDAALADALSRSDVPILPMVVDALLDPRQPLAGHHRRAAASRRARSRPRPRPPGPRRPGRPLRRAHPPSRSTPPCPCSPSTCPPSPDPTPSSAWS